MKSTLNLLLSVFLASFFVVSTQVSLAAVQVKGNIELVRFTKEGLSNTVVQRSFSANIEEGCQWLITTHPILEDGAASTAFSDGLNLYELRAFSTNVTRRRFRMIDGKRVEITGTASTTNKPVKLNEATAVVTTNKVPSFELGLVSPLYHGLVREYFCRVDEDDVDNPPWEISSGNRYRIHSRRLTNEGLPSVLYTLHPKGETKTPTSIAPTDNTNGVLEFLALTNIENAIVPLSFRITRFRVDPDAGDYPILSRVSAIVNEVASVPAKRMTLPAKTMIVEKRYPEQLGVPYVQYVTTNGMTLSLNEIRKSKTLSSQLNRKAKPPRANITFRWFFFLTSICVPLIFLIKYGLNKHNTKSKEKMKALKLICSIVSITVLSLQAASSCTVCGADLALTYSA